MKKAALLLMLAFAVFCLPLTSSASCPCPIVAERNFNDHADQFENKFAKNLISQIKSNHVNVKDNKKPASQTSSVLKSALSAKEKELKDISSGNGCGKGGFSFRCLPYRTSIAQNKVPVSNRSTALIAVGFTFQHNATATAATNIAISQVYEDKYFDSVKKHSVLSSQAAWKDIANTLVVINDSSARTLASLSSASIKQAATVTASK